MRSCRRWSQADSLALDSAPAAIDGTTASKTACNSFRIGGPVSASSSSTPPPLLGFVGRHRFGGPASLQQAYDPLPSVLPPPPPPQPLQKKPLAPPPPLPPSPSKDAATAAPGVAASLTRRASPPQTVTVTVADLPAIPESLQWDQSVRRRTPGQPQQHPPDCRLERNGSAKVSGRNAYRAYNKRTASPANATTGGVTTVQCHRDNQVRFTRGVHKIDKPIQTMRISSCLRSVRNKRIRID